MRRITTDGAGIFQSADARGSPLQHAAAVRAPPGERSVGARGAERALEAADAGIGRLGWQRGRAALARRLQLQHALEYPAPRAPRQRRTPDEFGHRVPEGGAILTGAGSCARAAARSRE